MPSLPAQRPYPAMRCAGAARPGPASQIRACCQAGVPVRLLPRRRLPSLNEGFLSLLPGCLGAGAAGFDKWKWKSPSWGPALCGGVCTQLAAVASWECLSGGRRSHLVPPASMEAALAKRVVGLGALGAMAAKEQMSSASGHVAAFHVCHSPG